MEFCIENIDDIAREILGALSKKDNGATVVALSGDLGAGKTTLTQSIGRMLGVKENMISPTFVIMKSYVLKNKDWKHLIHIDAYRLKDEKELKVIGWDEIASDGDNLILIEWPEIVKHAIPKNAYNVTLQHVDEKTRRIDHV